MDGSAIFVLHTITHTRYCYNWTFHCFPFLTPDILYMLHLFNRCYIKIVISLHAQPLTYHWYTQIKKACIRILWYNKRIQLQLVQLQGAMAPFTGQIRTSQEKKNPCLNRLAWQHLQMAERVCKVLWGACLRCLLNHWTDFKWLRPESVLLTVGWVM